MWLKPYLSSITCHYMSLQAKESVWHSDSHTKFQEKRNLKKKTEKESFVSHIIRDL